jgi:hypothetical protein
LLLVHGDTIAMLYTFPAVAFFAKVIVVIHHRFVVYLSPLKNVLGTILYPLRSVGDGIAAQSEMLA